MTFRLQPLQTTVLACLLFTACGLGAESPTVAHYYDVEGMRYLTVRNTSATGVELSVRFASEPGSTNTWLGQGNRKDYGILFAAAVEEGQDRGSFYVTKGGEAKMEILFKPGQKMSQDAGILGVYRRVTDEKRLQLAHKEFQAAEDRLHATQKEASHIWPAVDKPVVADWKSRWPGQVSRWMKIAYQPPEPPKVKQTPLPFSSGKDANGPEKDPQYWLKLAQVTAAGYAFVQQMPSLQSSSWDGEYDDGLGGHVSIRRAKDGKLRVTLSCTRVNENQGMDLTGQILAEAVKTKDGESTAAAVFIEGDVPDDAKEVSVSLKRRGGFLWVETQRKATPPGSLSWLDGIYRWSAVPVE